MFSKLFLGAVSASLLFSAREANAGNVTVAYAMFNNENVTGFVSAYEGMVYGVIDVSRLNLTEYGIDSDCYDGGLSYHVHEMWDHNTSNSMTGPTACGPAYTGGHWDPWLACGTATGNDYCRDEGGCVNGSSVLGLGYYTCSDFDINPYSCEVGDWSGKYGKVNVSDNGTIMIYGYSPYEVDAFDLVNLSVVFHCGDGQRAFCAPFDYYDVIYEPNVTRPEQDENLVAYMGDVGSYFLFENGVNLAGVNISSLDIPDDCGNMLYYRIFDDWNSSSYYELGSDCDGIVGSFYDPTVSCMMNSSNPFCYGSEEVCDDSNYTYTCDYSEYGDRYLCAPADLSGKFGAFYIDSELGVVYAMDDLMVDLDLVRGGSIVFQCSNSSATVACAGLMTNLTFDFTTTMTPTTTEIETTEIETTQIETTQIETTTGIDTTDSLSSDSSETPESTNNSTESSSESSDSSESPVTNSTGSSSDSSSQSSGGNDVYNTTLNYTTDSSSGKSDDDAANMIFNKMSVMCLVFTLLTAILF